MYTLYQNTKNQTMALFTNQNGSVTSFGFDINNTDYQQFKKELANGVELKDADGNQMTPEQITTFLETLP